MKKTGRFDNLNILLIDDDEEDYLLTKKTLQKTKTISTTLTWSADYEDGLKQCGEYDAILVDYRLGERNGIDLITQAKEAECTSPFILLTGVSDKKLGIVAIRKGAEDYLNKTEITPELLERSILYAIERFHIRQKEHELRERKKIELLKDEFLSIASHELKTPLTTIKGYIQLLDKHIQKEDDPKALRYIHQCDRYVDKLNQLISDLLDISRIQSGRLLLNLEEFSLCPLLKKITTALQHLSSKHTLRFACSCEPTVIADKERIEQVLTNLLTNAIKYSPNAGDISIQLTCDDRFAQIAVTDQGVGISQEDQNKLFKRFYRVEKTAKQYSGLGIGLYISSEIISRHGGNMWVESQENSGSTFYFTIPLQNSSIIEP